MQVDKTTDTKVAAEADRATTSCTECQRRKQKCSREWPCDHCRLRKVPHLCQFSSKKSASSSQSPAESLKNARRRKRSGSGHDTDDSASYETADLDGEDELTAWGYMPGHPHYDLHRVTGDVYNIFKSKQVPQKDEVIQALPVIPQRTLTDALVQNYLYTHNFRYYPIYPPTFLDQYSQWWADRVNGKQLSPQFTCLLLRVCACSTQSLEPNLQQHIEFELAENAQSLTERFHQAAEKLSSTFAPGQGGLAQVQQLFLTATWFKSEGLIVDAWHALGSSVKEAQELYMHKDFSDGISDFDLEMRRRVWCLLYVWDWQMSNWLSRPLLIDYNSCSFQFPNLRLEDSDSTLGLVSPFAHIMLMGQLIRTLSTKLKTEATLWTTAEVFQMQDEIEKWIDALPPPLRVEDADTSFDKKFWRVILQRHYLHGMTYMVKLNPLKPYLVSSSDSEVSDQNRRLKAMGVDCCLKLLNACDHLFALEPSYSAKFHLVIFCTFDSATVLCSAILHDKQKDLPQRPVVLEAIGSALRTLKKLKTQGKPRAMAYSFLAKMVRALPLSYEERTSHGLTSNKRTKTSASSPESQFSPQGSTTSSDGYGPGLQRIESPPEVVPMPAATDNLLLLPDLLPEPNPFGDFSTADLTNISANDFGGMENVWDWQTLDFDFNTMPDGQI